MARDLTSSNSIQQIKSISKTLTAPALGLMALATLVYTSYIALFYVQQEILEWYSFRLTQTALTAQWFVKEGFKIAYETPVGGAPWTIPFEFPIYQYIVALLCKITGANLGVVGRLVSFTFFLLCLVPAWHVVKKLKLNRNVFWIFAALFLSSPVYIFWSRAFMIETTALFLTVATTPFFIDVLNFKKVKKTTVGFFMFFSTLALLQKVTTALPVLFLFGCIYLFQLVKVRRQENRLPSVRDLLKIIIFFGAPLLIAMIWTKYTDILKAQSLMGEHLTSKSLSSWNWGTFDQRLDRDIYKDIIGRRIFSRHTKGLWGLAVMVLAFFSARWWAPKAPLKSLITFSFLAGLLPVLMFINLHRVHDYYQAANVLYIVFGLAVVLGESRIPFLALIFTGLTTYSNIARFRSDYKVMVKDVFPAYKSKDIAIGGIIKRDTPESSGFIAYGNEWNSSFSYLAERKSLTVPYFLTDYLGPMKSPETYLGSLPLSAMVFCAEAISPTLEQITDWTQNKDWVLAETNSCYIALPKKNVKALGQSLKTCEGSIDSIDPSLDPRTNLPSTNFITVKGWTLRDGKLPQSVQLISNSNKVVETVMVPRKDVSQKLENNSLLNAGFSVVLSKKSFQPKTRLKIQREFEGIKEICELNVLEPKNKRQHYE